MEECLLMSDMIFYVFLPHASKFPTFYLWLGLAFIPKHLPDLRAQPVSITPVCHQKRHSRSLIIPSVQNIAQTLRQRPEYSHKSLLIGSFLHFFFCDTKFRTIPINLWNSHQIIKKHIPTITQKNHQKIENSHHKAYSNYSNWSC